MSRARRTLLVAHVINRLDVGGLENGVVNLVNRLPRDRYSHAIVCLSGFSGEFRRRIESKDVQIVSLDKKPGKDVAAYWRMWRLLRVLKPDIVHTRNIGTIDMQAIAALAGVRARVHGEHGWEASDPRGENSRNIRIRRVFGSFAHVFVPMSRDIARWLTDSVGIASNRIVQLYNGVDVARFKPRNGASSGAVVRVGTIGRLDPVKNQEELLRAFHRLVEGRPERSALQLVIAGDGPLRSRLKQLAAELGLEGQVELAGATADVPALMRTLDLFILPSLNEGISNTILEAMATGVPVVAAKVGGNPELVVDGETGALYDPADPSALEKAIAAYVHDPQLVAVHGAAARARAVECFSLESMVSTYDEMYTRVCSRDMRSNGGSQGEEFQQRMN